MQKENKDGSELSEIDVPLPAHAATAAGQEQNIGELEMGSRSEPSGIMVTKSFDASHNAL